MFRLALLAPAVSAVHVDDLKGAKQKVETKVAHLLNAGALFGSMSGGGGGGHGCPVKTDALKTKVTDTYCGHGTGVVHFFFDTAAITLYKTNVADATGDPNLIVTSGFSAAFGNLTADGLTTPATTGLGATGVFGAHLAESIFSSLCSPCYYPGLNHAPGDNANMIGTCHGVKDDSDNWDTMRCKICSPGGDACKTQFVTSEAGAATHDINCKTYAGGAALGLWDAFKAALEADTAMAPAQVTKAKDEFDAYVTTREGTWTGLKLSSALGAYTTPAGTSVGCYHEAKEVVDADAAAASTR